MEVNYMTSKWMMALCVAIAILLALPSSLAMQIGIGGSQASQQVTLSSAPGNSMVTSTAVGSKTLESSGNTYSGFGGGAINVYHEWVADNGATAASYFYLAGSGGYKYDISGKADKTTASASQTLNALAATNFLAGGFAFNTQDYAGTYVRGSDATTLNYKNSLSASASRVTATQSFDGTGLGVGGGLLAKTWAERGNIGGEMTKQADTDAFWAAGAIVYPIVVATDGPLDTTGATLYAGQSMALAPGTGANGININSKTPYKSTATLTSNTATSSQSASLNAAGVSADQGLNFYGTSLSGDGWLTNNQADTDMRTLGVTTQSNILVYSASNKAIPSQSTATQTGLVKSASRVQMTATGTNTLNGLTAFGNLIANSPTNGGAGMSATYTATANKVGSTTVNQKATMAMGEFLYKDIHATTSSYDSQATASVDDNTPTGLASTIVGQSTATASLTSAKVLNTGNWKVTVAAGSTYGRTGLATGSTTSAVTYGPTTPATKTSYLFTENGLASATTLKNP